MIIANLELISRLIKRHDGLKMKSELEIDYRPNFSIVPDDKFKYNRL